MQAAASVEAPHEEEKVEENPEEGGQNEAAVKTVTESERDIVVQSDEIEKSDVLIDEVQSDEDYEVID